MTERTGARLAGALLLALAPTAAMAQRQEFKTVEVFAARYKLNDRLGNSRDFQDGVGVRLLFEQRDPSRPPTNLLERTRGGVFAIYTAKQGEPDLSTLHVGLQTDVSFLPTPLGRVLDPFFSIGIGIFRHSRENTFTSTRQGKRVVQSNFALTPGLGTRVGLIDRFGARVDVRAPFIFGTSTTANVVGEGGLYFSF